MDNKIFKRGDIVKLKSGSPEMTVTFSNEEKTFVYYFNYESNLLSNKIVLPTVAFQLVN